MRSETSVCVACRQPIAKGARLCHQCGTLQSWRRHITVGSTVLSIAGAVASGIFASLGWLHVQLTPSGVSIDLHVLAAENSRISVLAVNKGRSSGAIASARLIMPQELDAAAHTPAMELQLPSETVVAPGAVVQVSLASEHKALPRLARLGENGFEFRIEFHLLEPDGSFTVKVVRFSGNY